MRAAEEITAQQKKPLFTCNLVAVIVRLVTTVPVSIINNVVVAVLTNLIKQTIKQSISSQSFH